MRNQPSSGRLMNVTPGRTGAGSSRSEEPTAFLIKHANHVKATMQNHTVNARLAPRPRCGRIRR